MQGPLLAALAIFLSSAGNPGERILNITVGGKGTAQAPCRAVVDGTRIPSEALPAFIQRWRGRVAHLRGEADTAYRCVGGIIFELQRNRYRIGFVSEPAAASVATR